MPGSCEETILQNDRHFLVPFVSNEPSKSIKFQCFTYLFRAFANNLPIPEDVLGKIAFSVSVSSVLSHFHVTAFKAKIL